MDIANIQAEFYHRKIEKIRNRIPKVNRDPLEYLTKALDKWNPAGGKPKFVMRSVTEIEVFNMIKNLKSSHAYGTDLLDVTIAKMTAASLVPVISHIINLSLGTSTFPQKWKLARVIPLLKAQELDKESPSSYRPVSQLLLISKLTERAFQLQLLKYLETTEQLSQNYHAYRDRHSMT